MRKGQNGFGLIEILVAASVMAILAVAMAQFLKGATRGMASIELRGEMLDAKQMVRSRLNCQKTFPAGTCPAASPITLKDDHDQPIFSTVDTTAGPFNNTWELNKVRVKTDCGGGKLELRFKSIKGPSPSWPVTAHLTTCQNVLGGTFAHACPSGETMVGINPETLEPLCRPELKSASGTFARSSAAGTTISTAASQLHTISLPFNPQNAICASAQDGYTNSWLSCNCRLHSNTANSVTFESNFSHGNHSHPVGCVFNYLIIGK